MRARTKLLIATALAALLGAPLGCGSDPVPAGKDGECARCHLADFQGAHGHPGKKPTTCAVCHTQDRWHPIVLDHRWPLEGAHEKASCFKCHTGDPPEYRGLGKECVDCHRKDYERAKNHEKKAETCEGCHTTDSWKTKKKKGSGGGAKKGE
jgi:hypothetical protein